MRLWAYSTSPHGLGLSEADFWNLTPREFQALEEVQQQETRRWAIGQATFVNVHIDKDSEPFLAEDFLGFGDREARAKARRVERDKGTIAAMRFGTHLSRLISTPDHELEEMLPEWWPKKGVGHG